MCCQACGLPPRGGRRGCGRRHRCARGGTSGSVGALPRRLCLCPRCGGYRHGAGSLCAARLLAGDLGRPRPGAHGHGAAGLRPRRGRVHAAAHHRRRAVRGDHRGGDLHVAVPRLRRGADRGCSHHSRVGGPCCGCDTAHHADAPLLAQPLHRHHAAQERRDRGGHRAVPRAERADACIHGPQRRVGQRRRLRQERRGLARDVAAGLGRGVRQSSGGQHRVLLEHGQARGHACGGCHLPAPHEGAGWRVLSRGEG
mmetsp:Transcript_3560/g.13022  ORF Transcript_3560/g.13022 Transcript_3560/m.13022 type:complete len:255 (-) Transcript_3560:543-1307(-)